MISEVEFALEDKSAEFGRVRTIEWVGFPEFMFGMGVVCLTILLMALENAVASALGSVVPVVLSGVSSSTGLMCTDPGCVADILVGVVGWVEGWVSGMEFTEVSMSVKCSNPAAFHEFRVVH